MFDGKGSWEDYQAQLDIVATLNGWTDDRLKATYLAVSLGGAARAVLGDLSEAERGNYKVLVKALDNRFGTGNRAEIYRATLKSRTRKKDESLPELAQAITRLTRLAFPGVPSDIRDTMDQDNFIDALCDADTRWKVHQSRPKTLNDALMIAVELEAFLTADQQRGRTARAAPAIPESTAGQNSGQENPCTDCKKELQEVKDLLTKIVAQKPSRPRRPDGCWSCGDKNHLARSCPNKQQSGNGQQPSSRA